MKCNLMENLHASHEKSVLPILSELADEQLDMLQDKQQMIEFMMFLGHQIARTKAFRDGVLRAQPRRNIVEIEVANAMTHAWWFLSYMFGMNIGFSLYSSRHDTRHALLVNDTEHPFITSDQRSSMYMRVSQRQNSLHLNTLISITQFRLALPISSAIPNDFYQAKIRLMRPLLLSSILKWRPKLWCISSVIPRAPFYPFKNTLEAVMQVEHPFMRIEINYLPLKIVARFTCLLGNNHSE